MAVLLYPLGKQGLISASVNFPSDNIKVSVVSSAYTYSASHQFFSDLTNVLGSSANLGTKTVTNGAFAAANTTITSNATATAQAYVLWKDTGTAATSPLVLFYDGIQIITIAASSSTSTAITTDPLPYAIANSAVLTRVSGTGPSSVTLGASGGGAANARALTAAATQSMVAGDTYSVAISGVGLPLNVNNAQTVNVNFAATIFAL